MISKDYAEHFCIKSGGTLYVPRSQPNRGEFQQLYQTLGLPFGEAGIHLGLTQNGIVTERGVKIPVLVDDLGLETPFWIKKYSRSLFQRSEKDSSLVNVILRGSRMFLVQRRAISYGVCISLPEGFSTVLLL